MRKTYYINKIFLSLLVIGFMACLLCLTNSCAKDKGKLNSDVPSQENPIVQTPTTPTVPTVTTQTNNAPKEGMEIGDIAWNLDLKDTTGTSIKLSSLRGKIVLLDFWATWCKPCRVQNDKLKSVYTIYKDTSFAKAKGFEVYMVSVFDKIDIWHTRLTVEKYNWKYNLFDEGGAAQWRYNVQGIPMNFLLDSSGVIIAKNIRDTLVENALNQLIK
jgi:peroxiredoxin